MNRLPLLHSLFLLAGVLLLALAAPDAAPATVHVQPVDTVGPRAMEAQTRTSVIQAYVQAWRTMGQALDSNRSDLLEESFIGSARDRLAAAIQEQRNQGLGTTYTDVSHDIKIVFYSPEGLSIQLLDDVEYVLQVKDQGLSRGVRHIRARYVAVLTPTEVRWKVRVFQAVPAAGARD